MFEIGDRIVYEYNKDKPKKGIVIEPGQKSNRVFVKLDSGGIGDTNIKYVRLDKEINKL